MNRRDGKMLLLDTGDRFLDASIDRVKPYIHLDDNLPVVPRFGRPERVASAGCVMHRTKKRRSAALEGRWAL